VDRYGIERGDVVLSLQLALTREEEQRTSMAPVERVERPRPVLTTTSAPRLFPMPQAPSNPVVMFDPDTGAGTVHALHRDLSLYDERPEADRSPATVVAITFQGLDQIRFVLGDRAAGELVKGLVEVAPFALRARDRVYRSGWDRLLLFLQGANDQEVEAARCGLELALGRFLSDRGFPEVRLIARRVDPAALAG
jgi:hypothetical protein